MLIDWSKIRDGANGFEKLATDYVQTLYTNIATWKQTSQTRDGNKDAVAIIYGYKSNNTSIEEWWMEAKYSTEKNILTRYRLDATIVSAILTQNVSRIIFVSNIQISTKTISDIKIALQRAIGCYDVNFYMKYDLEYWLSQDISLYQKYFEINNEKEYIIDIPDMFVIQGIDYFTETSNCISFREPLKDVYIGNSYFAYFNLFSPIDTSATVKAAKGIRGIKILDNKELKIKKGENPLHFHFKIKENYKNNRKRNPNLCFSINNIELISNYPIIPKVSTQREISLEIQEKIIKKISNEIKVFSQNNMPKFNFIYGRSGVGKSHMIDKIIREHDWESEDIYYSTFTDSKLNNYEKLLNMILFILFPFVSPLSIDVEYLKEINQYHPYVSFKLIELIEHCKELEKIAAIMDRHEMDEEILPSKVSINRKFIVFDDLHKLDNVGLKFFTSICNEFYEKKIPIFLLGSAQPIFYTNPYYKALKERCTFLVLRCEIKLDDIVQWLGKQNNYQIMLKDDIKNVFSTNVLELFLFSQYLIGEKNSISDIKSLVLSYKLFQKSNIMENHILNQFKTCFATDNNIRNVCDKIYWNPKPFVYSEEYAADIETLLYRELVKIDSDNSVIPYHDIYKNYYQKHFSLKKYETFTMPSNSPERIRFTVNHELDQNKIIEAIEKIEELIENKQFYTVVYILEDLFQDTEKSILINKFGNCNFYRLYLLYALAAHQQTTYVSCKKMFEQIYEDTMYENDVELLTCCLVSYWELLVIQFEHLNYSCIKNMSLEIENIIIKINSLHTKDKHVHENIYYQRTQGQKMLVLSDSGHEISDQEYFSIMNGMTKNGFPYLCESFTARYAVTLMNTNPQKGINLLDQGRKNIIKKYGSEDKHYLWCEFYYHFYNLTYNAEKSSLPKMLQIHDKMKRNQYGNYRKKLYAIACYFYIQKDYTTGNKYLFKDAFFSFELNPRYQAFFEIAISLYDCLSGNTNHAVSALKKAAAILEKLPNYSSIPLHNITLIEQNNFNNNKIKFWFGEEMLSDTFYIDSRSAW